MNRLFGVLFIAVPAALVCSCAPARKITVERTLSAETVLALVRSRNETIRTLKGSGTITVESPEASNSGSFDLSLKKPDSLRLEFSGPFGISVGSLMLSRREFFYYNRMNNTVTVGKPDGTTLKSLFRIRMRFDEVLNAFTGEFPADTPADSRRSFSVEGGSYVVKYKADDGVREYHVDGDAYVVTSYRVADSYGKTVCTAFASDLDDAGAVVMPRFLRVVFPLERRSITIVYDDLAINQAVSCSFSLPRRAEIFYR